MPGTSEVFEIPDQKFRDVCRLIFGEEIDGLKDYVSYFQESTHPYTKATSSVSGKEVYLVAPYCSQKASFVRGIARKNIC